MQLIRTKAEESEGSVSTCKVNEIIKEDQELM
jgi:hypothetical protein